MKTLKDLGAAAVAVQLEEEKDIAKLEIPKTLLVDLMKAFLHIRRRLIFVGNFT